MGPYHIVLSHFPVALWLTATLVIVIRAFSAGTLARNLEKVLVPLLLLGAITGMITFGVGLMVWPFEAIAASPLGRNHLLTGSWTLTYWIALLYIVWQVGAVAWQGVYRWIVLGLGLLGASLLGITGALGGHLSGSPTAATEVIRALGWEVYTTFYVPTPILWVIGIGTALLVALAVLARKKREA